MATIYQRGEYWYLNYSDSKGRHRQPLGKIGRKRAELQLKKKEIELSYGPTEQSKLEINFVDYVNMYLEVFAIKYPSSYETSQHTLLFDFEPLFKNYMLHEITINDVNGFIGLKISDLKAATINRKLSILRAMLNQAKADGFNVPGFKIKEIPDKESRPPKYFTVEELELIYKEDDLYPHWWKFLANTGLRMGEMRQLRIEDIHKDSIHVVSSAAQRTKSGKWRYIPINKSARESLDRFDMSGEYLLPRQHNDSPITRFRRICERAGIKKEKWGVHCLRHTFASHLVMSNVPLRTVQILLGHASIQTTERYAHLSPDYLKDSLGNLNL
jgi:integrase